MTIVLEAWAQDYLNGIPVVIDQRTPAKNVDLNQNTRNSLMCSMLTEILITAVLQILRRYAPTVRECFIKKGVVGGRATWYQTYNLSI